MGIIRKLHCEEKGIALSVALVILLVGTLLVVPAVILLPTQLSKNTAVEVQDSEFYAADAGAEYALWRFQHDTEYEPPDEGEEEPLTFPETINSRDVDVTVSNEGEDGYKITSVATSDDGGTSTVVVYVELPAGSSGSSVWDYALLSLDGDITMGGNSDVEADVPLEGDIHANGDISLSGNAEIDGDASATGSISTSGNADVNGISSPGADEVDEPEVDTGVYEAEASAVDCPDCGTITQTANPWNPPQGVYADREHSQYGMSMSGIGSWEFRDTVCVGSSSNHDLNVSGITDVSFEGPFSVSGDIDISTNRGVVFYDTVCVGMNMEIGSNSDVIVMGKVRTGEDLIISANNDIIFEDTIYVLGDLYISGNADVILGGNVYVKGEVTMSGNADLVGGYHIIAEGDMVLTGNSDFNEDADDLPFILSKDGNISTAGNSDLAAVLFAPNGSITLTGNTDLYGCAVAKDSIIGGGNNDVLYPTELRNREDLPDNGGGGGEEGLVIKSYSIE